MPCSVCWRCSSCSSRLLTVLCSSLLLPISAELAARPCLMCATAPGSNLFSAALSKAGFNTTAGKQWAVGLAEGNCQASQTEVNPCNRLTLLLDALNDGVCLSHLPVHPCTAGAATVAAQPAAARGAPKCGPRRRRRRRHDAGRPAVHNTGCADATEQLLVVLPYSRRSGTASSACGSGCHGSSCRMHRLGVCPCHWCWAAWAHCILHNTW